MRLYPPGWEIQNNTYYVAGPHTAGMGARVRVVTLSEVSPQSFCGTFRFSGGPGPQTGYEQPGCATLVGSLASAFFGSAAPRRLQAPTRRLPEQPTGESRCSRGSSSDLERPPSELRHAYGASRPNWASAVNTRAPACLHAERVRLLPAPVLLRTAAADQPRLH